MSTEKSTSNWFKYLTEDAADPSSFHASSDTGRVVPDDREGLLAKQQLFNTIQSAQEVMDVLGDDDELEAWVQSKLTKISSMMSAVNHYLKYEYKEKDPEKEEIY